MVLNTLLINQNAYYYGSQVNFKMNILFVRRSDSLYNMFVILNQLEMCS